MRSVEGRSDIGFDQSGWLAAEGRLAIMKSRVLVYLALSLGTLATAGQTTSGADFKLALAVHPGQIKWKAEGFKIVESSAKPDGLEIGIRGLDGPGRVG